MPDEKPQTSPTPSEARQIMERDLVRNGMDRDRARETSTNAARRHANNEANRR